MKTQTEQVTAARNAAQEFDEQAGDFITVEANQGDRDGTIVARLGDEIVVEYEMPAGTTALRAIKLGNGVHRSVSYLSLTNKWGNAIEDQFGICNMTINPQGGGSLWKERVRSQVISKFAKGIA